MAKKPQLKWSELDIETKKLYVRVLRVDGFSDSVIGTFFGTTKNAVVGFRHSQMPELTGGVRATLHSVRLERLLDLLEIDKMDTLADQGVTSIAPTGVPAEAPRPTERELRVVPRHRQKLAVSERTQCTYRDSEGHRCAFEYANGRTKRCLLH